MNQVGRVIVTLTIWIGAFALLATALTSVTGPVNNMNSGELLGLVAVLALSPAIATAAIWSGGKDSSLSDEERRSKAKRIHNSRVQRLLSDLDDDEVYELEALLLNRDDQQQSATRR